jgi:hypothetical protein
MKGPLCLLLFVLAVAIAPSARAQGDPEVHTRLGDRYFERMAYAQARDEYKVAADMGAVNEHVTKRLAECYMKLGDTVNGEIWYGQVVKFLNREPLDVYRYAQALKGNGKYPEAQEWMDRYLAMTQTEGGAKRSNIVDFAKKLNSTRDRFTVRAVPINSPLTDLGVSWYGDDRVIFSSARDSSIGVQWRAAWNGEPFLDLFSARRQPDGELTDVRRLQGNINSRMHDGPAVVAPDGTLWYTRTGAERGKDGVHRLSILHAHPVAKGWSGEEPFLYNNPECSVGHPAISRDGKYFFFVSDMPGGFGGTDIYMCKDVDGLWGEPVNLGPGINTARNELFPFMAADGTLYFSTSGLPGLGGLDIFAAEREPDGDFAFAVNVGAPVNGPKDDFAFAIDPGNTSGYFSSNRPGGDGGDDIYAFVMHYPLEERFLCTGTVIDDEIAKPVANAEVVLLDSTGAVVESARTDAEGKYSFPVKEDKEYSIRAQLEGHYDGLVHLSTENIGKQQILARDVHLVPDAGIWLRGAVGRKDKLGFMGGVKVSVVNMTSFYSEVQQTDAGGDFFFRMQPNEQFEVILEKPGYFSISVPVSTMGMKRGVIELGDIRALAMEPVELGRPMPLKYVTWSDDGVQLAPAAKAELDELANRMQVNPALTIEVAVHADSRQRADAALKLTQQRADAITAYLRSKGASKDRLTGKGYGLSKPLNPCGPGVECTDRQHAENQRVEYIVTGIVGS